MSWITVTSTANLGDGEIRLNILPNQGEEREGNVLIYALNDIEPRAMVHVKQTPLGTHPLSLSSTTVVLEDGETKGCVEVEGVNPHGWTSEIVSGGERMEVSQDGDRLHIAADALRVPYRTGQIDVLNSGNRKSFYGV